MQKTAFNVIDVFDVIKKNIKQIVLFVLVACIIAAITLFIVPNKYQTKTVIISANATLSDKERLFNKNIQSLNSNFGNMEDLERLLGIAKLDTTYITLIKEFDLIKYYEIKTKTENVAIKKAVASLKEDVEFIKNDLGQLQIKVTNKNKEVAANITNRIVSIIQSQIDNINKKIYQIALEKITTESRQIEHEIDSINFLLNNAVKLNTLISSTASTKQEALKNKLKQYYEIETELKTVVTDGYTSSLYVIEKASSERFSKKPDKLLILAATAITSFLFACLLSIFFKKENS